jgi:hypothetical protein
MLASAAFMPINPRRAPSRATEEKRTRTTISSRRAEGGPRNNRGGSIPGPAPYQGPGRLEGSGGFVFVQMYFFFSPERALAYIRSNKVEPSRTLQPDMRALVQPNQNSNRFEPSCCSVAMAPRSADRLAPGCSCWPSNLVCLSPM